MVSLVYLTISSNRAQANSNPPLINLSRLDSAPTLLSKHATDFCSITVLMMPQFYLEFCLRLSEVPNEGGMVGFLPSQCHYPFEERPPRPLGVGYPCDRLEEA